jgi:hypothetical protein
MEKNPFLIDGARGTGFDADPAVPAPGEELIRRSNGQALFSYLLIQDEPDQLKIAAQAIYISDVIPAVGEKAQAVSERLEGSAQEFQVAAVAGNSFRQIIPDLLEELAIAHIGRGKDGFDLLPGGEKGQNVSRPGNGDNQD